MYGRTEIVDWSMCISSPKGNIGGWGGDGGESVS